MQTLENGILVFENGPRDFPEAVGVLLEQLPPLVVVRGFGAAAIGQETRSIVDTIGRDNLALLSAAEHRAGEFLEGVNRCNFVLDRTRNASVLDEREIGPHFDAEVLWGAVFEFGVPALLGLSVQTCGEAPVIWRARNTGLREAMELSKTRGGVPSYLEGAPEVDQKTGDAVLFSQFVQPTAHAVRVSGSDNTRFATIFNAVPLLPPGVTVESAYGTAYRSALS